MVGGQTVTAAGLPKALATGAMSCGSKSVRKIFQILVLLFWLDFGWSASATLVPVDWGD